MEKIIEKFFRKIWKINTDQYISYVFELIMQTANKKYVYNTEATKIYIYNYLNDSVNF
jgi:hypothetical protein